MKQQKLRNEVYEPALYCTMKATASSEINLR